MKTWRGIASDVAAISDGAQMIRNGSFCLAGEFSRRNTLEISLTTAGPLGMSLFGASNGLQYIVQITSAGTVTVTAT